MAIRRKGFKQYSSDYYAGSTVQVFVGEILVDDIVSIEWSATHNKVPVYGYASQQPDAFARGQFLVQGTFSVNFSEMGYMQIILDRVMRNKPGSLTGMEGRIAKDAEFRRARKYNKYLEHASSKIDYQKYTPEDNPSKYLEMDLEHLDGELKSLASEMKEYEEAVANGEEIFDQEYYNNLTGKYEDLLNMKMNKGEYRSNMAKKFNDSPLNPAVSFTNRRRGDANILDPVLAYQNIEAALGEDEGFNMQADMGREFENIAESLEDRLWGAEEESRVKRVDEHDAFNSRAGNSCIMNDTFDLIISFGDQNLRGADHTVKVINDVHILGESIQTSYTTAPIIHKFNFMARHIDERPMDQIMGDKSFAKQDVDKKDVDNVTEGYKSEESQQGKKGDVVKKEGVEGKLRKQEGESSFTEESDKPNLDSDQPSSGVSKPSASGVTAYDDIGEEFTTDYLQQQQEETESFLHPETKLAEGLGKTPVVQDESAPKEDMSIITDSELNNMEAHAIYELIATSRNGDEVAKLIAYLGAASKHVNRKRKLEIFWNLEYHLDQNPYFSELNIPHEKIFNYGQLEDMTEFSRDSGGSQYREVWDEIDSLPDEYSDKCFPEVKHLSYFQDKLDELYKKEEITAKERWILQLQYFSMVSIWRSNNTLIFCQK